MRVLYRFNFWNPLTYVVIVLALVCSPFIAMFILGVNVGEFYRTTFEVMFDGINTKPKKNLMKLRIFKKV